MIFVGHCDLFVIWELLFGIYGDETNIPTIFIENPKLFMYLDFSHTHPV